jgi:hypothetical protein
MAWVYEYAVNYGSFQNCFPSRVPWKNTKKNSKIEFLALCIEFLNSNLEFFCVFPASLKENIIGKSHNAGMLGIRHDKTDLVNSGQHLTNTAVGQPPRQSLQQS